MLKGVDDYQHTEKKKNKLDNQILALMECVTFLGSEHLVTGSN